MDPYVDVLYRGLEVAKRVRLADFQSGTGYLEVPAPMPAGTEIEVVTDGGVRFAATVRSIHEQVGGVAQAPGMRIAPSLSEAAAQSWWAQQVQDAPVVRVKTLVITPEVVAAAVIAAERQERSVATEPGSTADRPTRELSTAEVIAAVSASETLSMASKPMARATAPRYQLDTDTIVNPPSRYQLDADTIVNPDVAADADGYADDGRSTQAMDVIDRETLEALAAEGAIVEPVDDDDAAASNMFTTGMRSGSVTAPIVNEASGELTAGGKKNKRNKKR